MRSVIMVGARSRRKRDDQHQPVPPGGARTSWATPLVSCVMADLVKATGAAERRSAALLRSASKRSCGPRSARDRWRRSHLPRPGDHDQHHALEHADDQRGGQAVEMLASTLLDGEELAF